MRRTLLLLFVLALAAASATAVFRTHDAAAQGPPPQGGPGQPPSGGPPGGPPGHGPPQPFEWNQGRADTLVMHMLENIKGKEDMPAESVYKNIKILNGMPAKRLPGIMVMAFGRSLGMRCSGCHVHDNFSSDENPHKRVAREMWAMTQDLNKRVLPAMKDLDTEMPTVNCWTCHRGSHTPAVNPDARPDSLHGMPKPEPSH